MQFLSEITVKPISVTGGDAQIVAAARVSTTGKDAVELLKEDPEQCGGLIKYLVRMRHGTPFEHSSLTFFVHAPAFVWWEWVRHRIGQTVDCDEMSFNLESGRYKKLDPTFWLPKTTRKLIPTAFHKSAKPDYQEAPPKLMEKIWSTMKVGYEDAWNQYEELMSIGCTQEVARAVLGFGIYYSGWITMNARSLMHFLSLRTHNKEAKFVSYPQAEIEEAARVVEKTFEVGWPICYSAFNEYGRVAP